MEVFSGPHAHRCQADLTSSQTCNHMSETHWSVQLTCSLKPPSYTRINMEIKKMLGTVKCGKARGRERKVLQYCFVKDQEIIGILILKHYRRAIWMGERECLRGTSRSRVKGREWEGGCIEVNNSWALHLQKHWWYTIFHSSIDKDFRSNTTQFGKGYGKINSLFHS